MEACAEHGIPLMVLDRPNPNIHRVDGPVLEDGFTSFVGLHPVPVVYGMSIAEYAKMINGEYWLKDSVQTHLRIIPVAHYSRSSPYSLPIPPSPNLPTMESVYLYPSLCLFEGTRVSVGRGTPAPFTVIGEPDNTEGDFSFVPKSIPGVSTDPKHQGQACRGYDLSEFIQDPSASDTLDFTWLWRMHRETVKPGEFFLRSGYFDKLAGTDALRLAIEKGKTLRAVRESWQSDLNRFLKMRESYLIYPEKVTLD
jgi:uncharacterized protein YbbC (DUF1343 family)